MLKSYEDSPKVYEANITNISKDIQRMIEEKKTLYIVIQTPEGVLDEP